jgi:hypothetical protein
MEPYPWQQHDNSDETNEVFADYFLNWTYNSFNGDGTRQYQWMNSQTPNWVP